MGIKASLVDMRPVQATSNLKKPTHTIEIKVYFLLFHLSHSLTHSNIPAFFFSYYLVLYYIILAYFLIYQLSSVCIFFSHLTLSTFWFILFLILLCLLSFCINICSTLNYSYHLSLCLNSTNEKKAITLVNFECIVQLTINKYLLPLTGLPVQFVSLIIFLVACNLSFYKMYFKGLERWVSI